ncbi:TetR/AcrR family transcriptional regulator [Mycobacterium talmoniae]|uniref:Putative HTH-type transcriptional regulator n=1 Tax=Mycobacterium talmoniae TaxID=1858794 RepID=A0A1S1NIQ8_9MYCO|nr:MULTISPECIES: TetR/AcrR family transcriptional regulator [Mycobacterium]OHV03737.1 TetR family transcriptional regulator [Mycobacterium talmoniae]PQM49138.1 putative HTH-type transcriptional regulator [Mycobacterium talmoniae]TDH50573.1 TetR/AcrR family transcriptional regulator [Mycobacterium eburneum]
MCAQVSHDASAVIARVLDAAGELFAQHDPGTVGMREIARAAGCSRATLYRYFENRHALHTAYVHREAESVYRRVADSLADITDPHQRLITGITRALALVRQSPPLASWFAPSGPPIGAEMADRSEGITAMVAAFLTSLWPWDADPPEAVERRARWIVRVMTSLLSFPGRDANDERAMLTEFVLPVVAPTAQTATR